MELKQLKLENRIHKLSEKDAIANAAIIKKLQRQLRKLTSKI